MKGGRGGLGNSNFATPTNQATLICGTASRCTAVTAARKVSAVRSSAVVRFGQRGSRYPYTSGTARS